MFRCLGRLLLTDYFNTICGAMPMESFGCFAQIIETNAHNLARMWYNLFSATTENRRIYIWRLIQIQTKITHTIKTKITQSNVANKCDAMTVCYLFEQSDEMGAYNGVETRKLMEDEKQNNIKYNINKI